MSAYADKPGGVLGAYPPDKLTIEVVTPSGERVRVSLRELLDWLDC